MNNNRNNNPNNNPNNKRKHTINALICAAAIGAFAMAGCKERSPDAPSPTVAVQTPGATDGGVHASRGKPHNYDR